MSRRATVADGGIVSGRLLAEQGVGPQSASAHRIGQIAEVAQLGHRGRRHLVGPQGEHGGEPGQPGQRRAEQGHAAGIGPLQIVDDEQRTRRRWPPPAPAAPRPAAAPAGSRPSDAVTGRRPARAAARRAPRGPAPAAPSATAASTAIASRSSERASPHASARSGRNARAATTGSAVPPPDQLGDQPRLARTRGPGEGHDAAPLDRVPQRRRARRPARRTRARRNGGGRVASGAGTATPAAAGTSPRSSASCRRSTSGEGSMPSSSASAVRSSASRASAPAGSPTAASARASSQHGRLPQRFGAPRRRRPAPARCRGSPSASAAAAARSHTSTWSRSSRSRSVAGPLGVGVLGQRLAPQRQRRRAGRAARRRGRRRRARAASSAAANSATSTGARAQRVAPGTGDDRRRVAERAAGPVDQHPEVARRIGGQPVRPQRLGQHVVRHQVGAAHRQHPQQRADLAPAERRGRDLLAVAADLEPPEQLQVHAGRHPHMVDHGTAQIELRRSNCRHRTARSRS